MERVHFENEQAFRDQVERLFRQQSQRIQAVLPEADIQHVGSTAVPDSVTKGDLDIQVRVPAAFFLQAVERLGALFRANEGSSRTETFAAFQDDTTDPPLGVQLSVIGSPEDFFWKVRDVLRANPLLRRTYDALKQQYEGEPMEVYRAAKARFVEALMATEEFQRLD